MKILFDNYNHNSCCKSLWDDREWREEELVNMSESSYDFDFIVDIDANSISNKMHIWDVYSISAWKLYITSIDIYLKKVGYILKIM